MKRPDFLAGVGLAFALALLGTLIVVAPLPGYSLFDALRLLIPALSGLYLGWLLALRRTKVGKATTVLAFALVTATAWFFIDGLALYGFVHVALIGLVRACVLDRGPVGAASELLLCALAGIAASVALTRTGSVFLGVWTYFLIQAAAAFIPDSRGRQASRVRDSSDAAFMRAQQQAEAAFERLIER